MRHVTKHEFFAVLGPMNVNPVVEVNSLKHRTHVSKWMTPYREHAGTSFTDSWGIEPTRFQLENRWAQAR